jgi:hypothetical protein
MRIQTGVAVAYCLCGILAMFGRVVSAQDPDRPIPGKGSTIDQRSEPNPWRILPKIVPLEPAEKPGIFPASSPCYHAQSGWPLCIRHCALPSDTGAYVMYQVGGGCPFWHTSEPPFPDEGTWGWDYAGLWFQRRVILGWWHGRRYQGGIGAYPSEGPSFNHGEATIHDHPEK